MYSVPKTISKSPNGKNELGAGVWQCLLGVSVSEAQTRVCKPVAPNSSKVTVTLLCVSLPASVLCLVQDDTRKLRVESPSRV